MVDKVAMMQAFQEGAGFSAASAHLFLVALLATICLIWACILILNWVGMLSQHNNPTVFFISRIFGVIIIFMLVISLTTS